MNLYSRNGSDPNMYKLILRTHCYFDNIKLSIIAMIKVIEDNQENIYIIVYIIEVNSVNENEDVGIINPREMFSV